MKKLFFVPFILSLLTIASTQAEAARFVEKHVPSSSVLLKLWNTVERIDDERDYNVGLEMRTYQMYMSQGESLEGAIKQNVYLRRAELGSCAMPENVVTRYFKHETRDIDAILFEHMLLYEYQNDGSDWDEVQMSAIREFLNHPQSKKNFALFRVHDYNDFGYCDAIAFFNRKSFELTFIGPCYAE